MAFAPVGAVVRIRAGQCESAALCLRSLSRPSNPISSTREPYEGTEQPLVVPGAILTMMIDSFSADDELGDTCPWCLHPTPSPAAHACVALTLLMLTERARSEAPRGPRRTFGDWWGSHRELAELDVPTDDDELPEPF